MAFNPSASSTLPEAPSFPRTLYDEGSGDPAGAQPPAARGFWGVVETCKGMASCNYLIHMKTEMNRLAFCGSGL